MNNKNCFLKFINKGSCSFLEFENAYHYVTKAKKSEKKMFFKVIFNIMDECFNKMILTNDSNFKHVRNIYNNYGLNDLYFRLFFDQYLERQNNEVKEKYKNLKENEKLEFYKKIYNEVKRGHFSKEVELQVAEKYDMSYYAVRKIVKMVATSIFNLSEEEFEEMRNTHKCFYKFITSMNSLYLNRAVIYYQKYATQDEKNKIDENIRLILEDYDLQNKPISLK